MDSRLPITCAACGGLDDPHRGAGPPVSLYSYSHSTVRQREGGDATISQGLVWRMLPALSVCLSNPVGSHSEYFAGCVGWVDPVHGSRPRPPPHRENAPAVWATDGTACAACWATGEEVLRSLVPAPSLARTVQLSSLCTGHTGDSFDVGRRLGVTSHSFGLLRIVRTRLSSLASLGTPYSEQNPPAPGCPGYEYDGP